MNYRPYPDTDRALHQVQRGRVDPARPMLAFIDEATSFTLTDWQKAWVSAWAGITLPKRTGRNTITAAIADQAVKAGEHVHVAGRDGVRCASDDPACSRLADTAEKD